MTHTLRRSAVRGGAVTVLLGLLGACATQITDNPDACDNPKSVACVHNGSSAGTSSSSAGGSASNAGGSSSSGGMTTGSAGTGTSSAGSTPTNAGGTAPTGTAGSPSTGGGGASAGGTTGAGGSTSAGGGGATSTGGGGGGTTSVGGMTGTGGVIVSTNPACTVPMPSRTNWVGTASPVSNADLPAAAFDADPTSRFSTGTKQVGKEWLQIDLGAAGGTVNQVTISTTNGDYGRHLQIRMSNTANDAAAPVLSEQDGMTGTLTYKFAAPTTGRYILISQTGMLMATETSWWSVMDITATCN